MIDLLIEDHPQHLFLSTSQDSDLYPNHCFLLLQKLKQTARKFQETQEVVNMSPDQPEKNRAVQDLSRQFSVTKKINSVACTWKKLTNAVLLARMDLPVSVYLWSMVMRV